MIKIFFKNKIYFYGRKSFFVFLPFGFILMFLMMNASAVLAKAPNANSKTNLSIPGEIRQNPEGAEIFFENGRRLIWPNQGQLQLQAATGTELAKINLQNQGESESGAEAMGIEVEERDLGGSKGKKRYLADKKKPQGQRFKAESLADKPEADAGKESHSQAQGVAVTRITYPNGASLLRFEGPTWNESAYFDRRKSFVYSEQVQMVGAWTYTLRQGAEGSFLRSYRRGAEELRYQYDPNDGSYRYTFFNAQQQIIATLICRQDQCKAE